MASKPGSVTYRGGSARKRLSCHRLLVFISPVIFWSMYLKTISLMQGGRKQNSNKTFLLELIKRRLKVHEKNMSRERAVSFLINKNHFPKTISQ